MKTAIVCSLLLIYCSTAIGGFKNPVSIISPIDQYVYAGERIDYSGLDSYDPDGDGITQYTWYIDDQQLGTGSGFSQTYMLDKTETHRVITIKLKVKDNEGAIDYYSYQIAIKRKPEYHFYVKDHLGNIRVTVNEQGEIVSKDDYYPFGLRMPGRSHTSGAGNDIYKFSGKELDDENGLGLYYFGARYYDAALGKWHSTDPMGQYHSPYVYTGNSPVVFIDPTGLYAFDSKSGGMGDFGSEKDPYDWREEKWSHSITGQRPSESTGATGFGDVDLKTPLVNNYNYGSRGIFGDPQEKGALGGFNAFWAGFTNMVNKAIDKYSFEISINIFGFIQGLGLEKTENGQLEVKNGIGDGFITMDSNGKWKVSVLGISTDGETLAVGIGLNAGIELPKVGSSVVIEAGMKKEMNINDFREINEKLLMEWMKPSVIRENSIKYK